jgi:hypothetical protein
MALVVVDAENVRRSLWPNLSPDDLVARVRAWALREGHDVVLVFDGAPPEDAPDLVGAAHADDEIVSLFETPRADGAWLVTSDRALRDRVGDRASHVVGGGRFALSI